ncbi:endothelin-converting enzyme 1-like [Dermacentor silvarum]|uniref:endothelin-converting enzyme 1-like n=1 Tax=Dermacentor silvarum TaxID=543639 RepID=UPI0021009668|nr:endothelin-converting enzyme 1-like [Dermacentor silvarum]
MNDLVLVDEISHLWKMLRIIEDFGDEVVLRHLSWLFVQAYGAVVHPMAVLLITHGSEHHATTMLPRFCAGQVESSYKLLLASMASVGLFSKEERRRIDDHLAAIVEEAADKTWAVSWLDNDTKKVAVEKLKNVRTVLWPSDKFLTAEALEVVYANFTYSASSFVEHWIETRRSQRLFSSEAAEEELLLNDSTQLPYAYYRHVLNHLTLSLGALAPPLYCKDGTNAMFYGGLLYIYARMLVTAIDSDGVKFNPQGEFVASWLSHSIQDTFEQRTLRCLPGNTSIFPEVPAMEVAYAAFKRRHQKSNNRLSEEAADKTWAVSWLDNDTKKVAVEKLKNVRTVLWPSDKFLTAEALEVVYANFTYSASSFVEHWIETRRSQRLFSSEAAEEELLLNDSTQLPYAYYRHVLNHLTLSLGALAPPLYCKDGTNAMFYGGLLYIYARMLVTAIDSDGVKFNPQGEFVASWLSHSIQDTFEQRTLRCLPGNASIFPEVPAMEVAYAAFKRRHQKSNNRLSEELTEEKVFFITACLSSCATTAAANLYGGDCNKAVMNFAPFAEAFGCPAGSKMNPASKCPFYD